ncbi:MAG: hypothetical protein M3503_02065 [Actinomycetota bacterium]|nr:hypothetical protein [Actinomycetota bacterium]
MSSSLMESRYPGPRGANPSQVCAGRKRGTPLRVFFFFSNRFGCLGSIMLSVVLTLILMAILRLL